MSPRPEWRPRRRPAAAAAGRKAAADAAGACSCALLLEVIVQAAVAVGRPQPEAALRPGLDPEVQGRQQQQGQRGGGETAAGSRPTTATVAVISTGRKRSRAPFSTACSRVASRPRQRLRLATMMMA